MRSTSTRERRTLMVSLLAVGLCLGGPRLSQAQGDASVSLDALMAAGRKNHPLLAKQPLLQRSLKLAQKKLNKKYWPRLSIAGQASWQSEVTSIDIPIPELMLSPPSKDQYRLALELQQSIWDGGAIAAQKRVAEKRSQVAQERVSLEWYQVRERILQLYFAGVVQQELGDQAKTLDRHLALLVQTAELSLDKGVATERDVLLVQARRLEAQQAIAESRGQLAGVTRSLEDLAGVELSARLATPPCVAAPRVRPAPVSVHRPELSLLAAQSQLLDAQNELDMAGDRPKLGAFASTGYGRPGLNALSDRFKAYFIGGVRLTVPLTYLYTGTRRNAQDQLAVQRSLIARQQDAVMTQVHAQLDAQNAGLARLDDALKLDEQLMNVRKRARQQTELQLSLGTATITDLIGDLNQEDQARTRRAVHQAQRSLACHQIEFIKGDL